MRNLTFFDDLDDFQGAAALAAAFDGAAASAERFGIQLAALGGNAAVFGILAAGFKVLEDAMSRALSSNAAYRAELGSLKAALTDAFTPVFNVILPGLLALMRILTAVFSLIGSLFGLLGGSKSKSTDKQAKAIRGVGRAAKEASKDLAAFDEINRLSDDSTGGGGGGGGSLGEGLNVEDYKARIDELTVYLSGALLAIGAILAFSGANIPLGLALMAMGAIGLASVVMENWDCMSEGLRQALTNVAVVLGGAALVIGAILAFTGANIPLGIGLMAAGAAALGAAAALNWNAIQAAMQGPIGGITALVSGALLVIGAILAFTGANIPLGIALMGAGAVGLASTIAVNWDAIPDMLRQVWDKITSWWNTSVAPKLTLSFWQEQFSGFADGMKGKIREGVNSAAALMNQFIAFVNSALTFSWGDVSLLGRTVIPAGSMRLANIPSIPMLAQGAVIPPNAPFMAMLGDQRSGNNLETPEALLRQIVREESGDRNVARLLEMLITTVQGIQVGDEVIGRAASRYQSAQARARGV